MVNIINVHWLPIKEDRETNTVKVVHQSLNKDLWPEYFPVKSARQGKTLNSSKQGSKTKQCETSNPKLHLLQMVKGRKVKGYHS